jgi:hypothetical protein
MNSQSSLEVQNDGLVPVIDHPAKPYAEESEPCELANLFGRRHVERLVEAVNACDESSFAAFFAPRAIIRDGGLSYQGPEAPSRWLRESHDRYALRIQLIEAGCSDGFWTFDAIASGAFEGSPVRLEYRLNVEAGLIVRMEI